MKRKTIQALILTAALAVSSLTPVSAAEMDTGDQTGVEGQREEPLTTEESQELAEEKILNEDQETIPGETEDNTDSSSDVVMPGNDGENPQAGNPQVENLLSGSWILNATGWWYAYDDGSWPSNGIFDINGTKYAFDTSGYMVTGWYLDQDGWYYFNGSGAMMTGWQLVGGSWYYLDGANAEHPGLMVSNCGKEIGGQKYFFNGSGAMYTGWALLPEGWYYTNGSGAMVTGWQLIGGTWYYLDGANAEHPGLMVSGGWNLINNAWYYMNGSGGMMSEWLLLGNTWYYLGSDGAMKTGWQQIGGAWYYFYTENDPNGGAHGAMAVSTTIDGWEILESGIAVQDLAAKINEIKKYIYVPYRYGGTAPSGWDCSGFTQWALYYLGGITIPRTTTLQAAGGTNIDKNHMELWKPGDVLVYQSGSSFTHVALYLGDGMLMHAINSKYGTMIQGVTYYEQWDSGNHLALVRRYL
ncbi:NlpC/P60 family protein [Mordavella massiliensis]|uniref:C40 family peptidase n=1 Tax=Mordavella massiliensis TaxID=1871024 RepID=A0A939BCS9_9CLOT|nr:NlpC/P60 family protein [Mordavella massiliensis]MBM6827711.1 C40 family peptidase [Mordavella massiliensis]